MKSNNVLRLSFGADPELAIYDNERQKMVSAIPVIGHDKDNPIMLGKDIKFYHDNILSEMAFPPSETVAKMVESFHSVFQKASKKLGKRYKLVPKAAHQFDDEALSDPRALESGCSPTLAVYRKEQNPPFVFKDAWRFAGGHIHIGNRDYAEQPDGHLMNWESKELAIRLLDVYLGTSSVIFDKDPSSVKRRQICEAGQFRAPEYGVEYRPLGNWYLRSPETTKLVYDIAEYSMSHLVNGTANEVLGKIKSEDIESAINNNDGKLAREILKKAAMPKSLLARVEQEYKVPESLELWGA